MEIDQSLQVSMKNLQLKDCGEPRNIISNIEEEIENLTTMEDQIDDLTIMVELEEQLPLTVHDEKGISIILWGF